MNVTWGFAHVDGMIVWRGAEGMLCAVGTRSARLEEAGNHILAYPKCVLVPAFWRGGRVV